MIIPWLRGLMSWSRAPLTWTLIAINVVIFLMTYDASRPRQTLFSTSEEIVRTGHLYQQYLDAKVKPSDLDEADDKDKPVSKDQWILIGSRSLRDPDFLKNAKSFNFHGDDIAISQWKTNLEKFQSELERKNSHVLGLLTDSHRPLTWITYQFMHAGWIHLFSNMMLFLIFGAALEAIAGSYVLVIVYLLGGIAGGLGFMLLSPQTLAPMIGASGSLSAVMAAYAVAEKKRRVAFFYFLSPMQGYYGQIFLPTLMIFPLCFVADVASYLATPIELGSGVAYTAHLGGMVFGVAAGLILRRTQPLRSQRLSQPSVH